MKIKVCGLTTSSNTAEIIEAGVDYIGLNFYAPSPRYVREPFLFAKGTVKTVGVFVNENPELISRKVQDHGLDMVQLHGDEDEAACREVSSFIPVIKVFRIDNQADSKMFDAYDFCKYFLFDTATPAYGGSGIKFNWDMLKNLSTPKPYFLSGGIGPGDVEAIIKINDPMFFGLDINSRFESVPGIKNAQAVRQFINDLNQGKNE